METPPQKISDQIDSNTKDTSTKDNSAAACRPAPVAEIIAHLNEVTGKRYSPNTKDTREKVSARWSEYQGMPYDERLAMFIGMIDTMVTCWKGTRWEQYLKPSTLFRPTKFDEYANMTPERWEDWGQRRDQPRDNAEQAKVREIAQRDFSGVRIEEFE